MRLTYLGNSADVNDVSPRIAGASLSEQWRPSDALYVNLATRYENDTYDLANTNNPGTNFWFAAAQKEFCVNPVTRQPIFQPQPPQFIYFYTPFVDSSARSIDRPERRSRPCIPTARTAFC